MRWTLGVSLFLFSTLAGAGCSSVPDVVFRDATGSTSSSSGGGDTSSSTSTSSSGGGTQRPTYRCPDAPPPGGVGICCPDDRLCLSCTTEQCDLCKHESCGDGSVCCARNKQIVDCKAQQQCN